MHYQTTENPDTNWLNDESVFDGWHWYPLIVTRENVHVLIHKSWQNKFWSFVEVLPISLLPVVKLPRLFDWYKIYIVPKAHHILQTFLVVTYDILSSACMKFSLLDVGFRPFEMHTSQIVQKRWECYQILPAINYIYWRRRKELKFPQLWQKTVKAIVKEGYDFR